MRKKVNCCLAMAAIMLMCGTFAACSGGAVPDDRTQEAIAGFTPCTIDDLEWLRDEGELGREQTNHVERVLINQEGCCEVFDTEAENITGIIRDIEALAWIAPRGGAGIISEGREIKEIENEYITRSNIFLSNETDIGPNDSSETWIRVVRSSVPVQTGTAESGYKDIIVYKQDDNACLAVQSSENRGVWTLWELPQYGVWLEKEAAIFMRVATGL